MLRQLYQDASRRRGVQKGDAFPLGANARLLVDQTNTAIAASGQRSVQIVHRKADVMDAGTAAFEESADRRVGRVGLQKLYQGVAGLEAADPGAIAVSQLGLGHSEDIAIK